MQTPFIHLHTHSHYSLLDGLSKCDDIVRIVKNHHQPAVALTDHGAMYGIVDFYKETTKHGIKPIIGVETYVANRTRFDKVAGVDNKRFHLTLLAKDLVGYRNMVRLITLAHTEGYYYKPRVDKDILRQYGEGIIALSGCPAGELGRAIMAHDLEKAELVIAEYQEIFGVENYYIEVMHHPDVEDFEYWRSSLISLGRKLNVPLVATQDSHYPEIGDARAHKTLVAIATASDVNDTGIFAGQGHYHVISTDEAYKLFEDIPDAVENTFKISERCNVELTIGKFIFPEFPLIPGKTDDDMLRDLCMAGLKRRDLEGKPEVLERLDYELGIIKFKGYASYFLVVEDLIRFSDENGIYTNIRGSVAGSMTTYLLGITKIDPLVYKIPFERFLNPERPSAPDIDMDFADTRREEVLVYAKKKYGADKVAQIGTFGTMMARGAVRDVARALGQPYDFADKIAKLVPMGSQGFPMTLENALELEPELKQLYDRDRDAKDIIDLAKKLEGCVRHISVHAAGVVISPMPLIDIAPTQFDPKGGKIITQYDMYDVGEDGIGLTKFDFLGIRNLTILGTAVQLVKRHRNIHVDLEKIPLDDRRTYNMLAHGETTGLFQLNGGGMTKWLVELKPSNIHDINAMVALYRPGPMQFIPDFIKRKFDPSLITYLDPAMEEILAPTYGILVYQDDLLIMANKFAGYSWGEVDKFRKAVGKKDPAVMAKQKEKFIEGCVEHAKWPKKKAEEVWAWIEPFAAYGFNKAHSASYGRVAYQTAYMKANYPAEYMTAVLSAEAGDTEMIAEVISACKRMNIPILPPDINESYSDFTTVKVKEQTATERDKIRFGLYTIKNLGQAIADAIITERDANGPFKSYAEFLERVKHKDLNKKSLESLIKCGAMDSFGIDRGSLLGNIEEALAYHKDVADANTEQDSLFAGFSEITLPTFRLRPTASADKREMLAWEKDLLGLYVSGHPLDEHRAKLEKAGANIKATTEDGREGMVTIIAGMIEEHKPIITKKGDHMAFLKIADFTGGIEVVVFPKTLAEYKDLVVIDKCVAIKGRFSRRNDQPSLVAEKIKIL